MIDVPEVENPELCTLLKALGNDALWSRNDKGELYTIVQNESGLRYIRMYAFDHPGFIEITPYPKDEKAVEHLKKGEDLNTVDRFQRITLNVNLQGFKTNDKNVAKREEGVKPRHIALCNAYINKKDAQPGTVETHGKGKNTIIVHAEKTPFLQIISPTVTAREISRCFPKHIRKVGKEEGGLFWQLPKLTLLTGKKAGEIKNKNELIPAWETNWGDNQNTNILIPVALLPAFLPEPAIEFLKKRYDISVPSKPQQLGLGNIMPDSQPWQIRARTSKRDTEKSGLPARP